MSIGTMTVAQAIGEFNSLAKTANSKGPEATAAKAKLVQIQQEMWVAGYYGTKKPKPGVLSGGGLDDKAFRAAMVDAANSGQKAQDFLTGSAQSSASTGTAGANGTGGGTTVVPAARIQGEDLGAPGHPGCHQRRHLVHWREPGPATHRT